MIVTANRRAEARYLASLSRLRPFEACSTQELKMVARACTPAHIAAGSVLVREGAPSREFLIVASGSALVSWEGLSEKVIGSGDWFGDLDLLSASMSSATVSTLTDVELIVMSRSEFSTLFETVGSFRSRIVRELASRARSFVPESDAHAHLIANSLQFASVVFPSQRASRVRTSS